jgi:glycosyltransferase involved in cell wall biosynthesis
MTDPASVLVIVPALDEERTVADVVRAATSHGHPVCVVDDGSTDATAERARQAGATVLSLPLNLGVGGALRCGFRWALAHGYATVVQVDADGQHSPAEIEALIDALEESGADMVIGTRFADGSGTYEVNGGRRFAMRLLAWRASRATRRNVTDSTSGFRAIRRPLLDRFARDYPVEYLGDTVEALIDAGRAGYRIVERPIAMAPRAHGTSTAGLGASLWYVLRVLLATELMRNRRSVPPPSIPSDHGVEL